MTSIQIEDLPSGSTQQRRLAVLANALPGCTEELRGAETSLCECLTTPLADEP
jgi:hypothetical protein